MPRSSEERTPRWPLRLALAAAVSAFLLAVLLRLLQPGEGRPAAAVFAALRNIAWPFVWGYVVTQVFQVGLRAVRYGLLLRAAGDRSVPSRTHLALATMARNMFVDLLPSRSGELIFVGLLNRVYGVAVPTALSALALSFVFDLAGLGAVLLTLVSWELALGGWSSGMAAAGVSLLALAATGLVLLVRTAEPILAWARRDLGAGRLRRAVKHFAAAVVSTHAGRIFPQVFTLTLGIRAAKYIGLFLIFLAVTTRSFPELAAASPRQVLAALIGSEATASLPLPTLMSFGAYEAGGIAAWALLGFDAAAAAFATIAAHITSQIVDYTLGGIGLLLVTLAGGHRARATVAPFPLQRKILAGALAACALAAGVLFALREWRSFTRQGALAPPNVGNRLPEAPRPGQEPRALLGERTGFVVWSSNRAGNHDLWRMDLPGGTVARLTRDPHVENHARISPEGRRVLFARSREPWVSLRDPGSWDAWVLDLATGRETRIAEFAYRPTWVGSGSILFLRRATQVVRLDLATGAETIVAEEGRGGLPHGAVPGDPSIDPRSGLLAVTVRGTGRFTAILDGMRVRKVGGGCQLAWAPDGASLVLVDDGGRMTNAVYRVDSRTLRRTLLLDAPEPFSHEYFPVLTADGLFLVYAASAGGHEHDTEDYEVFLWRVGDPPESVSRLTWHTGNDSWPDIFLP